MNGTESNERDETNETGEHLQRKGAAASAGAREGSPVAVAFGGRLARIAHWRSAMMTLLTFLAGFLLVVVLSTSPDQR